MDSGIGLCNSRWSLLYISINWFVRLILYASDIRQLILLHDNRIACSYYDLYDLYDLGYSIEVAIAPTRKPFLSLLKIDN